MKLGDAHPENITMAETKAPQASSAQSPSIVVWLLHWVSALLVLFLIATSLTSGLEITARLFPAKWMDWHLSAGVALLAITAVRMKSSRPWNSLTRIIALGKVDAGAIRSVLLFGTLIVTLLGVAIFQKPPFGRSGYLLGLFPMPTLVRLDHSLHNVVIDFHIALSCLIAALIIAHVIAGLRCAPMHGRSRLAIMLWPWRKS